MRLLELEIQLHEKFRLCTFGDESEREREIDNT